MSYRRPILWDMTNNQIWDELSTLSYKYGTMDSETGEFKGYPGAGEYGKELGLIATALQRIMNAVIKEEDWDKTE